MKKYEFVEVSASGIHLLSEFISKLGEAANTFRYYQKRSLTVIENHRVTLLLVEEGVPVAYGHLDFEDNIVWLGIAVLPGHQGQGLGNTVMEELIRRGRALEIKSIDLTVDKVNMAATKMYERFNFKKISDTNGVCRYRLTL